MRGMEVNEDSTYHYFVYIIFVYVRRGLHCHKGTEESVAAHSTRRLLQSMLYCTCKSKLLIE